MARSGPFHRSLIAELRDPEFAEEYDIELRRIKGDEVMTFEGTIWKIVAVGEDVVDGGIFIVNQTGRGSTHIGLTDDEAKHHHVGQRVRVTVEAVEE